MKVLVSLFILAALLSPAHAQDKVQDDIRAAIASHGRKKTPEQGTNGIGAKVYNPGAVGTMNITPQLLGPDVRALFLQPSNNLTDVLSPSTAVSNLGAVHISGDTMQGPLGLPANATGENDNNASTTSFVGTAVANFKTYILALLQQNYTLQVPSATALRNLVGFSGVVVHRSGFASPGDGGDADFVFNSSTCPTEDGGSCLNANGGGSWRTDISRGASIKLWGAVDDDVTDNRPAIQAGLNALGAIGGGKLIVPSSAPGRCFRFAGQINYTASNEVISGQDGQAASCFDPAFAGGAAIQIGNGTIGSENDDGIQNIAFKHSVTRTSGADLEFFAANNSFATNVTCHKGFWQCIDVGGSGFGTRLQAIVTDGEGQTGICLGCNTGGIAANVLINDSQLNFNHGGAIECVNANGDVITNNNMDFNTHAFWAHPGANQSCSVIHSSNTFYDLSFLETVLLDGTAGLVSDFTWTGVWIASSGKNPSLAPAGSFATTPVFVSSASGLQMNGANLLGNDFADLHVINNGGDGINLGGGAYNNFSGISTGNNGNGLSVAPSVLHWSWVGQAGGQAENGITGNGGYGVNVSGGDDYFRVSGDLTGNTKGGLANNSAGTHTLTSQILQ